MTKPANVLRFCPRCGSGRFNAESFKSFFCDDCNFHFFINSAASVAALIVNPDGELLLTIRANDPNKGMLDLPGGFVDPGESAENALRREIKEELNLDINAFRFLVSYPNEYVFSDFSVFTTDLGFICDVSDFSAIHYRDDITGFKFLKPADIKPELICAESIRSIIRCYMEHNADKQ